MSGIARLFATTLGVATAVAVLLQATTAQARTTPWESTVCHKPGTPAEKTLTLPPRAAQAHLRHGDALGPCAPTLPLVLSCARHPATLVGTPGDDVLVGTSGADVIVALGGNDTIFALEGDDRICSGDGDDVVDGGEGNDFLSAGPGFDVLDGATGTDTCLVGERITNCENPMEAVRGDTLTRLADDTDGDGILDEREELLATNPGAADTDGDGFHDGVEDRLRELGFDPLVSTEDRDRDGLADAFELSLGTSPGQPDSDADGWSDLDEVLNGFFGYDPLTATGDTDFDGLADTLELNLGTRPDSPDSDADGLSDFEERRSGSNPSVPDPPGGFIELGGLTASGAMLQALETIRAGGAFPVELAAELPFSEVTQSRVAAGDVLPSAALLLSSGAFPQGLYDSYNEVVNKLRALMLANGSIVQLVRIRGNVTSEGRDIWGVKISDNPQISEAAETLKLLFMGLHHARELVTTSIAMAFIKDLTDAHAAGNPGVVALVDNAELLVIPLVNPDGYEQVVGAQRDWRKNTRRIPGQAFRSRGVDPNRNYGFEHVTSLPAATRSALSGKAKLANGLDDVGGFDVDSFETYAGGVPFSDAESSTVQRMVEDLVRGTTIDMSDRCSLSWHTEDGLVLHPMGHTTPAGLNPADVPRFARVSMAVADATGYRNLRDAFQNTTNGYPTYGDSEDWLYKDHGFLALTVEAYGRDERGPRGRRFSPDTVERRSAVVGNNIEGAYALAQSCRT